MERSAPCHAIAIPVLLLQLYRRHVMRPRAACGWRPLSLLSAQPEVDDFDGLFAVIVGERERFFLARPAHFLPMIAARNAPLHVSGEKGSALFRVTFPLVLQRIANTCLLLRAGFLRSLSDKRAILSGALGRRFTS